MLQYGDRAKLCLYCLTAIADSLIGDVLNLNSVNQLIFVMVKCGVLFEVRTGFLNNI
jgi:hypothetical protein